MARLISCQRCTQTLPVSAVYCRRCGAVVSAGDPSRGGAPAPARAASGIFLSAILSVLLVGAIGFGGLVVFRVRSAQSISPYGEPYYMPPVQPVYPQVSHPSYPAYPPVQLFPVYPNDQGRDDHYHHRDEPRR
jgi:hypothetical protein